MQQTCGLGPINTSSLSFPTCQAVSILSAGWSCRPKAETPTYTFHSAWLKIMLGCARSSGSMTLTRHELVFTGYQAASRNGGVPPTGRLVPAVPCPILPGRIRGGWLAQCERWKVTHWEPSGPHPTPCAHSRKCLEMTEAPRPPLGANTGCGQSLSGNNSLLWWPQPSLLSCSLGKHRPHAYWLRCSKTHHCALEQEVS